MSTPPDAQPTQEEIEAYLEELRSAPVQELLLQAFSVLGTGAEVKLGLQDARVLIDSMEALVGVAGPTLGEPNSRQLQEAVAQLKMAQVQAEKQLAQEGGSGAPTAPEAQPSAQQAASTASTPPTAAGPAGSADQPTQKATDKLWIPGRDG